MIRSVILNDTLPLADEWDKGIQLVLASHSPFSDPFRVVFIYFVTVLLFPSLSHCHRARLHPAHHASRSERVNKPADS